MPTDYETAKSRVEAGDLSFEAMAAMCNAHSAMLVAALFAPPTSEQHTAPARTDRGHGSPYDRGGADYWYGRPFRPHCFAGATHATDEITDLTPEQLAEYRIGYEQAEAQGNKKDWG